MYPLTWSRASPASLRVNSTASQASFSALVPGMMPCGVTPNPAIAYLCMVLNGSSLAASGLLLGVERSFEVPRAQGRDHTQVIVQDVEKGVSLAAHAVEHNTPIRAAAFTVCVPSRTGGEPAGRAHLPDLAVGFVENMFAVEDEGVGEGEMPVQKDLFVGCEFDNEVGDVLLLIDGEYGDHEVFEVTELAPLDITVVEAVGGCQGCDGGRYGSFSLPLGV